MQHGVPGAPSHDDPLGGLRLALAHALALRLREAHRPDGRRAEPRPLPGGGDDEAEEGGGGGRERELRVRRPRRQRR